MPKAKPSEGIYRKKGSKYYHMCIYIDEHKTINRSTRMRTKAAALKVYEQTRERLLLESFGDYSEKTPNDILALWKEMAEKKFGDKYVKAVQKSLELHWSTLMDKKVAKIKQEEVHGIEMDIVARNWANESYNKAINAFSCLITFAKKNLGWFKFVSFKFERKEITRKAKAVLNIDQVPAFLALVAAEGNQQALMIIAFMLAFAFREIEARYACWSNFYYNAEGLLLFKSKDKNGNEKSIAVPDWLEVMIRRYEEIITSPDYRPSERSGRPRSKPETKYSPANSGTASMTQNDWMFPGAHGVPHSQGFSAPYIKAAAAKLNIQGLSPHRMRGSAANLLKLEGLSLDEIQDLLGHLYVESTISYLEQSHQVTCQVQNNVGEKLWPGASSLVRKMRVEQSTSGRESLLPPPPESLKQAFESVLAANTPATRLLPVGDAEPTISGHSSPEDPEHRRRTISNSIQSISLRPGLCRPPQELLSQLVWEIPTDRIADIYGVTATSIANWCEEWGIIKPERGYWSKVHTLVAEVRRGSVRYATHLNAVIAASEGTTV